MTLFAPPRDSAVFEADIPEGLRQYLETGELPGREAPGYRDALRLRFFGRAGELTFEDVWHNARDVILAEWASERPGMRPWAWWAVEAREVLGAGEAGRVRREGLPGEEQRVPKAAAVARSRRRHSGAKGSDRSGQQPWWGEGPPPRERWPGVTIELEAQWSKARARWESPDGRYYFDREAADRACDFFPTFLTHHIGRWASKPFDLLDYQRALIVRPLFGWKSVESGRRRFRFLFAFIPKGNGKSPLGSGLGLYLTLCDGEPAAEVYAVAGDKDQARIVHETAKVMVEQSEELSKICQVLRDSIYCPATRSFYKVLSAEASGKHGTRPHAVMFDELHNQPNRDLFEALRKSLVKRDQPIFAMLSHAGDDDESICYEEYEYAKGVLSGTFPDDAYLPVIFETAAEADWTDPEVWRRANPAFGVTINPEIYAAECEAAQKEPRKRNDFLRFNQNRWVGQAVAWIPVERWDACRGELADEQLAALECAAGLDMAQKIDLACFAVVFREPLAGAVAQTLELAQEVEETGEVKLVEISFNFRMLVRAWFWLPEETARDREREGFDSYLRWAEMGLLTLTEGAVIDYDRVYRDIVEKIVPRYPLLKQGRLGYDPAFATDIANRLRDRGGLQTVEVLQNYKHLSEPCQFLEGLVKARRFVHDGNALLRWCAENVAVKRDDAGRIRPVKPKKPGKKIDGVTAVLMGLSQLMLQPGKRPHAYELRHQRGAGMLQRL